MKPYYEAHGITIYHGDCRALALPEKPALVLADPPYGVNERTKRNSNGRSNATEQKPVALFLWCLMRAKLAPGALVYDPYMGSGPIAKACKQLGYRYIGCELVEQYCETTALGLQQEVMPLFAESE